MVSKPVISSFSTVGRCKVLLEKEISICMEMQISFSNTASNCYMVLLCLIGKLTCQWIANSWMAK